MNAAVHRQDVRPAHRGAGRTLLNYGPSVDGRATKILKENALWTAAGSRDRRIRLHVKVGRDTLPGRSHAGRDGRCRAPSLKVIRQIRERTFVQIHFECSLASLNWTRHFARRVTCPGIPCQTPLPQRRRYPRPTAEGHTRLRGQPAVEGCRDRHRRPAAAPQMHARSARGTSTCPRATAASWSACRWPPAIAARSTGAPVRASAGSSITRSTFAISRATSMRTCTATSTSCWSSCRMRISSASARSTAGRQSAASRAAPTCVTRCSAISRTRWPAASTRPAR